MTVVQEEGKLKLEREDSLQVRFPTMITTETEGPSRTIRNEAVLLPHRSLPSPSQLRSSATTEAPAHIELSINDVGECLIAGRRKPTPTFHTSLPVIMLYPLRDVHPYHRLPPELVDNIIELCSDDRKTLFTLALVCKLWLPLVQYYLFDRICLKPPPRHEKCSGALDCGMAGFIRHVTLELQGQPKPTQEVQCILKMVDRIKESNRLSNLGVRFYNRPDFTPYRRLFDSLSLDTFSNIVELNVSFNREKVLPDMIRFICSFPNLQIFGGYFFVGMPHNSTTDIGRTVTCTLPLSLKTLHLDVPSGSVVADYINEWLSSHSQCGISELSFLRIWSLKLQIPAMICSETLKTLNLGFHYYSQVPEPEDCDLSPFRALESLTLIKPHQESHFNTIMHLLDTVASPCLQTISVVNLDPPDRVVQDQLKKLDDALSASRFSNVMIEVHFAVSPHMLHLYEWEVRRCLEKCFGQGRLVMLRSLKHKASKDRWSQWSVFESGIGLN
ncbi:hypothetical protein L218DRAFT_1032057 [Marasmius fiardii PR-910]|nr:hypothetical protein L218DRAFT_1032057 [Marasmius fiardii PR-910]